MAIFPPAEEGLRAAAKSHSGQEPSDPFYFEVAGKEGCSLKLQRIPNGRFAAIIECSEETKSDAFAEWELIFQLKDGTTQSVGKLKEGEIIKFSLSKEDQPLPVYIRKDGEQINLNVRVD